MVELFFEIRYNICIYYLFGVGIMFYCTRCGFKIEDNNNFCTSCGMNLNKNNVYNSGSSVEYKNSDKNASIILGIISLVGCFLIITVPVSLVLGIIGLILSVKSNKMVGNVIGIVLNVISILISIILCLLFILCINFIISGVGNNEYIDEYEDMYEEYLDDYKYKYDF